MTFLAPRPDAGRHARVQWIAIIVRVAIHVVVVIAMMTVVRIGRRVVVLRVRRQAYVNARLNSILGVELNVVLVLLLLINDLAVNFFLECVHVLADA